MFSSPTCATVMPTRWAVVRSDLICSPAMAAGLTAGSDRDAEAAGWAGVGDAPALWGDVPLDGGRGGSVGSAWGEETASGGGSPIEVEGPSPFAGPSDEAAAKGSMAGADAGGAAC